MKARDTTCCAHDSVAITISLVSWLSYAINFILKKEKKRESFLPCNEMMLTRLGSSEGVDNRSAQAILFALNFTLSRDS